jgi:DNA/RNA-binding domain of Phe-tRNA-synthetase-like protein
VNITISNEIKKHIPHSKLGILRYKMNVNKSTPELLGYFESVIKEIEKKYEMTDIAKITHIKETREAYKALGKSPSQYRNASEAMLRRIVKGNGLYTINNAVEINNLISVLSGYSIGTYDMEKLAGYIELRRAPEGERYQGIGKAEVNIANLPVLYDEEGPFGNPTSDSHRAMMKNGEREVISLIYSFNREKDELKKWLERYRELLQTYAEAVDVTIGIV